MTGQAIIRREIALRDQLKAERAKVATLAGYIEQRNEYAHALEVLVSGLKERLANLEANPVVVPRSRERLPDTRRSETWTLRIGPLEGGTSCTLHLGFYDDGRLGEVFLRFGKAERGTHGASMADLAVTMLSIALQYGAPLEELVNKMVGAADESGGVTRVLGEDGQFHADPECTTCRSLRDYIGKKLRARSCQPAAQSEAA